MVEAVVPPSAAFSRLSIYFFFHFTLAETILLSFAGPSRCSSMVASSVEVEGGKARKGGRRNGARAHWLFTIGSQGGGGGSSLPERQTRLLCARART